MSATKIILEATMHWYLVHTKPKQQTPESLFNSGERVKLISGAFGGIEGIYQMADGERRAMC